MLLTSCVSGHDTAEHHIQHGNGAAYNTIQHGNGTIPCSMRMGLSITYNTMQHENGAGLHTIPCSMGMHTLHFSEYEIRDKPHPPIYKV